MAVKDFGVYWGKTIDIVVAHTRVKQCQILKDIWLL